ncbi:molybdate ABC transporter substrate-binding protein [Nocardiopsis sediminis]|uniref:Molybdate ABC transporter substrate-binding protein n=1 Tax=Nocardiopsis sediminis TaxID=1778267 RepID=A0ABV8FNI6_9ACTN
MREPTPRRPSPVSRRRRPPLAPVLAAALLLAAAGCGQVDGDDPAAAGGQSAAERTLTVFAAASLTESFEELGTRFEEAEPGVAVEFNFAGSSELAQQINEGAPADVFASANPANMDLVAEAGGTDGEPAVFVRNILEIAVPPDNPAGIEELADLAGDGVSVALCAAEVPCGAAAETLMDETGVEITPVTEEEDVRAALTKVELGEVDAALVYRTDVIASEGAVTGIEFPEAESAINDYPIAALAEAPEPELARAWVELVTSETGAEVLGDAGFRAA